MTIKELPVSTVFFVLDKYSPTIYLGIKETPLLSTFVQSQSPALPKGAIYKQNSAFIDLTIGHHQDEILSLDLEEFLKELESCTDFPPNKMLRIIDQLDSLHRNIIEYTNMQ